MINDEPKKNRYKPYAIILSLTIIVYGLIYLFSADFYLTASNPYNSYSRQAAAWLSGRLDLGENVPWLELAVFEGKYYVSFPPFPSIIMLPFVLVFGINTPDNFIAFIVSLCSLVYAYKLGFKILGNKNYAILMSLFLVLGTNYLHISLWGSVWYIAQNMAFLFTLMAFYFSVTDNSRHSYIALLAICAAMGCRPFNALYLPVVLFLLFIREKEKFLISAKRLLLYSLPAVALGSFFMWLNYARFGNIFEFGHNYLPEFVNDPHGQFFAGRIIDNLGRMFFNLNITEFPMFHGFAFWLASPIVVSYFVCLALYIIKIISKRSSIAEQNSLDAVECDKNNSLIFGLLILSILHIIAFSFHRTLGGHQFGSRYTVDTLPAFYLGMLFMLKNLNPDNKIYLNIAPMLFGMVLNFIGTVQFMVYYYS